MKRVMVGCAVVASLLLTTSGNAMAADADAAQLATKYNCMSCHAMDKKLVGPSFKDIAKKYAGDETALATLEGRVKNGSSGVFGPIPMPPNSVPDADLKTLVEWILSLK